MAPDLPSQLTIVYAVVPFTADDHARGRWCDHLSSDHLPSAPLSRSNRQLIDDVAVHRKRLRDLANFVALLFRSDGTCQLDPIARNGYVYSTRREGWIALQGHCNFVGHFGGLGRRRVSSGIRGCVGAGGRTFNSPSIDR